MPLSPLSPDAVLSALIYGGHAAAMEVYELADDEDVPVYPESLVHVHVARALRKHLKIVNIELEAPTDRVVQALSGLSPGAAAFPTLTRPGLIDIVGWDGFRPRLFAEVKDQVGSSGDGIVEDLERLVEVMRITHKWERSASAPPPTSLRERSRYLPSIEKFGALVYYVGKNAQQYKKGRHLASQFLPFAERSVATITSKLQDVVPASEFTLTWRVERMMDSAKEGPADPALEGTEFEDTISGREQFTLCVACVLHMNAPLTTP